MYCRIVADLEEKIRTHVNQLGTEDPELAECYGQLAHLYFLLGRYNDAESLYWRAVTVLSNAVGQESLEVAQLMDDLGHLYEVNQQLAEAEHVYRLSYAVKVSKLGIGHHDAMHIARNMVAVVRAQGKLIPENELERLARVC